MYDEQHRGAQVQTPCLDISGVGDALGLGARMSISTTAWLACRSPRPDLAWHGAPILAGDILSALAEQIARSTPRQLADPILAFEYLPDYDAQMVDLLCVFNASRTEAQILLLAPAPDDL